jgi:hypothetical protein
MRSIWIAVGRDADFGEDHTVEDMYVFESSFDAHKFIRGIKHYMDIPDKVRNQDWSVEEHPINPSKLDAIMDFYKTHKEETNADN